LQQSISESSRPRGFRLNKRAPAAARRRHHSSSSNHRCDHRRLALILPLGVPSTGLLLPPARQQPTSGGAGSRLDTVASTMISRKKLPAQRCQQKALTEVRA